MEYSADVWYNLKLKFNSYKKKKNTTAVLWGCTLRKEFLKRIGSSQEVLQLDLVMRHTAALVRRLARNLSRGIQNKAPNSAHSIMGCTKQPVLLRKVPEQW